jgi:hypothetical protein
MELRPTRRSRDRSSLARSEALRVAYHAQSDPMRTARDGRTIGSEDQRQARAPGRDFVRRNKKVQISLWAASRAWDGGFVTMDRGGFVAALVVHGSWWANNRNR